MKTKEIEGPDKNRQEEQSQEISKYRGQFFSVLKKKYRNWKFRLVKLEMVSCVNIFCQEQLETYALKHPC